jgi:hypothetical protein
MIIAVIILSLIFIPVIWIVFVPVDLKINTTSGVYKVSQFGTVTMSLHPDERPVLRIRVFGFAIKTPSAAKEKPLQKKIAKKEKTKQIKSLKAWIELMNGVMKSFRCRRFICKIDFDDVVLNAQLFPVGYFINRGPVMVNVNFEKEYLLDIWIQARIHRIVWSFIRFYFTK